MEDVAMAYTVKQLADLAGISTRTLHYYDEIGLLKPTSYGDNGYRSYGEEAVRRLQQILFYRELDLSLKEIRIFLDRPDFDAVQALKAHKEALDKKVTRLKSLIHTIDKTIAYMKGQIEMSTEELFEGFDEETQELYEQEAAQRWGDQYVKESRRRWDTYSEEKKSQILQEAGENYRELVKHIGRDPASEDVQELVARWHQNLRYFYEPTKEIMLGLAEGYSEDPEFRAFFEKMRPDFADFLRQAIEHYCEELDVPA
jgi:DNA-binding transcriptional MerR regulator